MPLNDQHSNVQFYTSKGASNDTSAVELVPDPASTCPYIVDIENLGILNEDTATRTMIVTITGGTPRVIERISLSSGSRWTNPTRISIGNGETLTLTLGAVVTTAQMTWNITYFQVID